MKSTATFDLTASQIEILQPLFDKATKMARLGEDHKGVILAQITQDDEGESTARVVFIEHKVAIIMIEILKERKEN